MARPESLEEEQELARFCVRAVQRFGGVLEHPRRSLLFEDMNLPVPGGRACDSGWTMEAPQWWWGHLGRKETWFYIVGCVPRDLPNIDFRLYDDSIRPVNDLSSAQRESTPENLACWLVALARRCKA